MYATPGDFGGKIADRGALFASWIACHQLNVRDLFSGGKLALQTGIERHHILPRARFDRGSRNEADTIVNISFISGDTNRAVSDDDPALYLAKVKADVLVSQCIPKDRSVWSINKAPEFWDLRRELLAEAFNAFLKEHLQARRIGAKE